MEQIEYADDIQITPEELAKSNPEALDIFGDWKENRNHYAEIFCSNKGKPFPYVVIENFLKTEIAELVVNSFPSPENFEWQKYHNPLEKKLSCNNLGRIPQDIVKVIRAINAPEVCGLFSTLTGIPNLYADPFLHGGGIHCHTRNGKLDMHLDYSIHPRIPQFERRLNLIIYLNKDWKTEYRGDVQFWDEDMKECAVKILPEFNRAVLFQTSDLSYHGLPDPIKCPPDIARKSIAIYYLSTARENATKRYKAKFVPRPEDPPNELLDRLREIRPQRRITEDDLPEGWDLDNE